MPSQYRAQKAQPRGVRVQDARRLLLRLPNVAEGRSYGMPSFLLNGRFLARFRDDDTVLVLQLGTIGERDVLMQLDPGAFFFTEHYRHYPAVLIRLAAVPRSLFADVVTESWRHVAAMAGAKMPAGKLLIELVRCLVLAYVIARFVALLGVSSWLGAVHFGLFLWIGFPVILLTGSVLWENIPWKVAAIHAGDWLVKMLVIPIIVSLWH